MIIVVIVVIVIALIGVILLSHIHIEVIFENFHLIQIRNQLHFLSVFLNSQFVGVFEHYIQNFPRLALQISVKIRFHQFFRDQCLQCVVHYTLLFVNGIIEHTQFHLPVVDVGFDVVAKSLSEITFAEFRKVVQIENVFPFRYRHFQLRRKK